MERKISLKYSIPTKFDELHKIDKVLYSMQLTHVLRRKIKNIDIAALFLILFGVTAF